MISKKYIDTQCISMLFSPVFASPHLRPFAASPLLSTSRIERSSRLISSIFRLHNSFRMSAHFARFLHHLSPFRMNTSGSVHSKQLYLPLESTLMKKGGEGGPVIVNQKSQGGFLSGATIGREGSFFKFQDRRFRPCRKGFLSRKSIATEGPLSLSDRGKLSCLPRPCRGGPS